MLTKNILKNYPKPEAVSRKSPEPRQCVGSINLSETSAATAKRQNLVNFTAATATLTLSNDV